MGKGKYIRGALKGLTDIFKAGDDAPVDESKRSFIRKSPAVAVGGAGALTGLGTATGIGAAVGAKALFAKGGFDDIVTKIRISVNDLAEDGDWDTFMKTNNLKEKDLADILEPMYGMRDEKLPEIIDMLENADDVDFSQIVQDIKLPLFTRELRIKFPELDPNEVDDLASRLF